MMTHDQKITALPRRARRLLEIMQDPPAGLLTRRGVDGEWRRPGVLPGIGRKTIHDLLEAGLIEPREPPSLHADNWFGWFRLTVPGPAGECVICGGSYLRTGCNAAPWEGRCCADCNNRFVTPARILNVADPALLALLREFARHGRTLCWAAGKALQEART